MDELIFDRTQTDIDERTDKGYYNASDLNRVELWCKYLADELNEAGYSINITTKTNWTTLDLRTATDMTRIKNNIIALMNCYHWITPIYNSVDSWNYEKANRWEQILNEIFHLMWGMEDWYVYSGVSNSGQPRLWQHRFRQFFVNPLAPRNPTLRTYFESSAHSTTPAIVNTEDYILIAGGMLSSAVTNTVVAYNSSLVVTQAPNLSANSWSGTAVNFNGRAIIAGGKSANSGSSRTNAVNSYTNNLTRTSLATLWDSVYESCSASNDTHFMVGGGSNWYSGQTAIVSYNINFVKTTPTSMSVTQSQNGMANVGNYIVRCGGWDRTGATDFYDNNNAKTTSPDPWGKPNDNVLGLALPSYAVFFGGATAYNSGQYSDCKAYDKNKVLTSFNMPAAYFKLQGFRFNDRVWFANGTNSYIYNDNLVMEIHETATENIYGQGICKQATATNGFAIHHKDGTSRFNVIDY